MGNSGTQHLLNAGPKPSSATHSILSLGCKLAPCPDCNNEARAPRHPGPTFPLYNASRLSATVILPSPQPPGATLTDAGAEDEAPAQLPSAADRAVEEVGPFENYIKGETRDAAQCVCWAEQKAPGATCPFRALNPPHTDLDLAWPTLPGIARCKPAVPIVYRRAPEVRRPGPAPQPSIATETLNALCCLTLSAGMLQNYGGLPLERLNPHHNHNNTLA